MSETEKPLTIKDLDKAFGEKVEQGLRYGDTRRIQKRYKSGHTFTFNKHERPYTLKEPVYIEVTQVWTQGSFGDKDYWHTTTYHTSTTVPAPRMWQRFKMWLGLTPRVPMAKVVSK